MFLSTCRALRVPAALERSRSGNGGHVWIFFSHPVPAASARRLGAWLVTESMERNPDIGFDSYDRLFPSQDTLPAGGFGNLIALPLQHRPRQAGNSVFLGDDFQTHADQWSYLSSVRRMTPAEVAGLTDEAGRRGRILGVRLSVTEEDDAPWLAPPSRKRPEAPITGPLPETVEVVLGDQVYVGRADLPASLVNRLARLAAFQNPEFYSAQGMRLPTYGIPRVIGCAELLSHHVAVPRGCRDQVEAALSSLDIVVRTRDERNRGRPLETTFEGELTREQDAAADALLRHDTGVLAATTAFGKTVVAASLIAARGTNTLVLERVLVATGRYVGEGFDDARLDTLFLTMPISWRGTLAQYAGRLHRIHPAKREVIVYDYVDGEVPVLARMSLKRITGFKSLGYSVASP